MIPFAKMWLRRNETAYIGRYMDGPRRRLPGRGLRSFKEFCGVKALNAARVKL
jgi:hypothetical protein